MSMNRIEIPEELNRVDIITKEFFDEVYKNKQSPNKEPNGRNGKFNECEMRVLVSEAQELYAYLKRIGKIKTGRNGLSKGLNERYFVRKYIGVGNGTIEKYEIQTNKHSIKISELDKENEKNSVCINKINPLLKRLGYKAKDIKCNEAIHMGRNTEKSVYCQADYQILSNQNRLKNELCKKYLNTAPIVIEAKFSFNDKEDGAFEQAVTYARRLCASYILISDRYNIRLYFSNNNYITSELIFECRWEELNSDRNKFNDLNNKIGRKQFMYDGKIQCYIRKNGEC